MLSSKLQNYFADFPFLLDFYGPEAADLGDLMRLWVRPRVWVHLSFVFYKDNDEHARHIRRQGELPTNSLISKQSEFMETLLNKKDHTDRDKQTHTQTDRHRQTDTDTPTDTHKQTKTNRQ